MQEYLNNFTTHMTLTEGLAPLTVASYYRELSRFFSVCNVSHPRKITQEKIDALRVALTEENLKKETIKHYLIAITKFLTFCKKQRIETLDPALVELPKTGKRLPKIRAKEQLEKVLAQAKTDPLTYAALLVVYSTGLRIHELIALPKVIMLDEDNGHMVKGKGDKDRIVYFSTEAMKAVQNYMLLRGNDSDPRLFPINISNLSARIHRAVTRAGLQGDRIGAHAFRHLCATELYRQSKDLISLQEYLGHESLNTTKIYAHITNADKKKMHNMLPSLGSG